MRELFKSYLLIALYFILISIPIIAFFSGEKETTVGSGPNVILSAIAFVVMLLLLIPHRGQRIKIDNGITLCILFLFFYVAVITVLMSSDSFIAYMLVRVLYPLLGFLCFYHLTKHDILDERYLSLFYFAAIIIITAISFRNLDTRVDEVRGLTIADNTGYGIVCAYAGVMLLANKKVFPFALFLAITGTLVCGKRGAIIAMAIATLPVVQYIFINRQVKMWKRILYAALIVVGYYLAVRYFSSYFEAAYERFLDLEEDEGSGRKFIYSEYWNHFLNSSFLDQLFGHGLYSATHNDLIAFTHVQAHNDWLEMLFDFGLVGTLVYATIFILMIKTIIQNRKNTNRYYYILLMSFIIWLVKSIFSSTFLMDIGSIYLFIPAAFAIAKLESNPYNNKTNEIASTPDE